MCKWKNLVTIRSHVYCAILHSCVMYKPEGLESAQDTPTPSSRHKGDLFTSEGQRQGIGKGEGRKGARELEGVEGYLPWRDKGLLWIERRHMW